MEMDVNRKRGGVRARVLSVKWLTRQSIFREVYKMKSLQFPDAVCDYFTVRAFATNIDCGLCIQSIFKPVILHNHYSMKNQTRNVISLSARTFH